MTNNDSSKTSSGRGGFFAIDPQAWQGALAAGFNAAVAFLVLASGTGASQRFTAWGAHSIETYTGTGRRRAAHALVALTDAGLLRPAERGWEIGTEARPDLAGAIWMPNSLVVGTRTAAVDGEGRAIRSVSPLRRIRETQSADALRLAVAMYHCSHLPDEGGLDRRALSQSYDSQVLREAGSFTVWSFKPATLLAQRNLAPVASFTTGRRNSEGRDSGMPAFWAAERTLRDIGVTEIIPTLCEAGDDGEIIHSLSRRGGLPEEARVGAAAQRAGVALLDVKTLRQVPAGAWVLPVPRHYGAVQLCGLTRLTDRPRTKMTAAWRAKIARLTEVAEMYEKLAPQAEQKAASSAA